MVEWLLDRGASIDAKGWLGGHVQGGTALHVAANSGQLESARLLVARGADVTARDALYNAMGRPTAGRSITIPRRYGTSCGLFAKPARHEPPEHEPARREMTVGHR